MAICFGGAGEGGNADFFTEEFDNIADLGVRHGRDIDHDLIHADKADLGDGLSLKKDLRFIAEGPRVTIAVADAEGCDG